MMQRRVKLAGRLNDCPRCRQQPQHYECHGRDRDESMDFTIAALRHILACDPCGLTTPRVDSFQGAIAAWDRLSDGEVAAVVATSPTNVRQIARRHV